jgi:hypothetical protein
MLRICLFRSSTGNAIGNFQGAFAGLFLYTMPLDDECLRRYHAQAIAGGRLSEALAVYEILMQRCPQHQALRSFYIALCLENGEPGRAMPRIEQLLASARPADDLLDAALAVRRRLDLQAVPADAPPQLSLCMIVRDEAARLAACLKAVKPLADDLVIVDTGSTDRTMDIARLFGARVNGARISPQPAMPRWKKRADAGCLSWMPMK